MKKIGEEKVKQELKEKGFDPEMLGWVQSAEKPKTVSLIGDIAKGMGVDEENIIFEPTLARGLDYYTDMIFEIEIAGYSAGSVCGGGRYDNLIGTFSKQKVPAVGCAFGFDRTLEAMEEKGMLDGKITVTKVLVTIFCPDCAGTSMRIASSLRDKGIETELWLDRNARMEKQLKYADQKGIPYVVIIGPEEEEKGVVAVRDMRTRQQKTVTVEELTNQLSK
ncbi:MAG: ATP phosphoribosyltransferase regulatory subunit [Candidatus Levybacteria bacterium]|nr:ATP phosphoribosyltransferase regulatory subunit [Candidatus Levybacteria bacterium]